MAKARVTLHSAGVADVLKGRKTRDLLRAHAERVASAARSSAPVETGAYRESIHVEDVTTDRAVARVVASAPHAHLVEARVGTLARALGSAGG